MDFHKTSSKKFKTKESEKSTTSSGLLEPPLGKRRAKQLLKVKKTDKHKSEPVIFPQADSLHSFKVNMSQNLYCLDAEEPQNSSGLQETLEEETGAGQFLKDDKMDTDRSEEVISAQVLDSAWTPRMNFSENTFQVEEDTGAEVQDPEVEEETMKEVQEQNYSSDFQEFSDEDQDKFMEEVWEQPSTSIGENSRTPFSQINESQTSKKSSDLQEALEEERRARAALEDDLEEERREKVQQRDALEQERRKSDALAETLKTEQAKNDSLCVDMELMKKQVDDLEKSQTEYRQRNAELKGDITEMSEAKDNMVSSLQKEAEELVSENKKLQGELEAALNQRQLDQKQLQEDREACRRLEEALQMVKARFSRTREVIQMQKKELFETSLALENSLAAEEHLRSCLQTEAEKNHLTEQQQEGNLEKDNTIRSLQLNIKALQHDVEAKDNVVSSLREQLIQQISDLKDERTKNCALQRDYEAAVSQQQKEAEELDRLTQENQRLASDSKRLQGELEAAFDERQFDRNHPREDREACGRLEKALEKEKARFSRAYKNIKIQEKELSEKTLALEKSRTAETYLRSCLKTEKQRYEQVFAQKQAAADPLTILRDQLREASACKEHLMYDMQTLRMENADIRAKFEATETECDRMKSKYRSLSERYEEMILKKNETVPENNNCTIAKLQCTVDELKAQQSETKRAEVEDALKHEKTRNSKLQQKVDQISSALQKVRATCEKYRVELKEALTKQVETLEEKQESGRVGDSDYRLMQRETTLAESVTALHHLQKEYADLGRRHCNISADYHELLKTHTALQLKYDRMCYTQGQHHPVDRRP